MSVDVTIIPSCRPAVTWGQLCKKLLAAELSDTASLLRGTAPCLMSLGQNEAVGSETILKPGGMYWFKLASDNTLTLMAMQNEPEYLSEIDYVEDFGRNLTRQQIEGLAALWREVGWHFSLDTMGGRARGEWELFILIASSLADCCDGTVVVGNDVFTLPVGIYSWQEFRLARPVYSHYFDIGSANWTRK